MNQPVNPVEALETTLDQPDSDESNNVASTGAIGGGSFQEQAARLLKLKIDGVEEELPEEEVIRYAQMGKKANKSMQEAAQEKNRILRLREIARSDPMAALKEFDPEFDEDTYFSKKLEKKLERSMKTKVELERDDALEELKKIKSKDQEAAKAKEEAEFDKLVVESRAKLDSEISDALKSISLKPSNATIKRLATYMLMARNENLNLSAKDLAGVVKQDLINEYKEQLELSDDDTFESLIGEKNLTRSQKIALNKMKKNPNAPRTSSVAPERKTEPASNRTYGFDSFLKEHLSNK